MQSFQSQSSLRELRQWLTNHVSALASVITALGFLARLRGAAGTFLNADEAQHFLAANQSSLSMAYESSLVLAHPPLLVILLYFWRTFGTSEFALRMLSVLTGIAFCWIFYKWVSRVLGERVALICLIFVSLLPPLVSLSAQVRQYSLLLLFAALSLYLFEKSVGENSPRLMFFGSISLCLAMLSHYSSLLFAAAAGTYATLRFISRRPSASLLWTWALGQFAALALFVYLYRTHISKLKRSSMSAEATEGWLRRSYLHPGHDHLFSFIAGRTFAVFQFLWGHLVIGDLMGLCFFAGLMLLGRSKQSTADSMKNLPTPRQLAVFMAFPFVLNCTAGLLGAYPYGGSRHSVFLVLFALSGASFFLASLLRQELTPCVAGALILVSVCAISGKPHEPNMSRADQDRSHMDEALTFIRSQIPDSKPLFVDVQTRLLLNYYVCPNQHGLAVPPEQDFDLNTCGGYRLITANLWVFTPDTFQSSWNEMSMKYKLGPADSAWVIQEGWSVGVGPKLKAIVPQYKDLKVESFGHNIQMFELTVGPPQAISSPARVTYRRPE